MATYYVIKCPNCGQEFERDIRNQKRSKIGKCCCQGCYDKLNRKDWDFQAAYNVAYSNWKPAEEPKIALTKDEFREYMEIMEILK